MTANKQTDEWNEVESEPVTTVVFDTIGDIFTGRKLRKAVIEDPNTGETWDQYQFLGTGEFQDGRYGINAGYQLSTALEKIPDGTECKIQYIKDVPVKAKASPMKGFRVYTRP